MRIIRISQGKAFSLHFRLVTVVILCLLIVGTIVGIPQPFSMVFVIVLSSLVPAVWFSSKILSVDLEENKVFKGSWVMGFKFGREEAINSIEKISIEKVQTGKTIYSLSNNQNLVTDKVYEAYLKTESGEKFFLVSHPVKETIIKKAIQVIRKLGLSKEILVLQDQ